MERFSVGLLNDSFPPLIDGVANAVLNYASEITSAGGNAFVVTPHYPGVRDEGYPFPVVRYPSIDTRKLVGYRAGYPFSPDVLRALQDGKVQLLHSHCPVSSTFLARQLRKPLGVPLVFTYHTKFDIDVANAIRGKLIQDGLIRVLAENISACDEVWVVSRGAGENLRSLGYEGDYTVMPNGVDMPRGTADRAAVEAAVKGYDLPADVPLYLFVGRLMWYKGLRLLLDALARCNAEKMPFRMVFIGSGADENEIRAYAQKLRLEDRCFFTGALHDREAIRAWYSRADLFLFPSTFDTNGLVVREAAACDLASVLIEGSCAAEGVTDGKNGFLVREDAAALAQKLRLLSREKMHDVGKAAGKELYLSWHDAIENAAEEYGRILERHREGVYENLHKTVIDNYMTVQGDLMDAFARLRSFAENVQSGFEQMYL